MKRINYLASLIQNANNVIDVGCDHCYLAIQLLKHHQAKYVLNIDINQKPLEQGIKNLKQAHLLSKTDNIINDGLKDLISNPIIKNHYDYVTIAGMGSKNIIQILEHNQLNIDTYILQSNSNVYALRKYLIDHKFKIISEAMVFENNIYYPIIVAKKTKIRKIYRKIDLYFGKLNNVKDPRLGYDYLLNYLNYLINNNHIKKYHHLIKVTIRAIKKYESKWDL